MTERTVEIPIAYEGVATVDNRYLKPGALYWDDGPLPLMVADPNSYEPIGTVNNVVRHDTDGPIFTGQHRITATLTFESSPAGADAYDVVVAQGVMPGIDLGAYEIETGGDVMDAWVNGDEPIRFRSAKLIAATVTKTGSAFQEHAESQGHWPPAN